MPTESCKISYIEKDDENKYCLDSQNFLNLCSNVIIKSEIIDSRRKTSVFHQKENDGVFYTSNCIYSYLFVTAECSRIAAAALG